MTQAELKAAIDSVNAETDNALATLTQVARQAVYSKQHVAEGLAAILAILNGDDPTAVTAEITAGPPREQP
jgi:hypothetical protein